MSVQSHPRSRTGALRSQGELVPKWWGAPLTSAADMAGRTLAEGAMKLRR